MTHAAIQSEADLILVLLFFWVLVVAGVGDEAGVLFVFLVVVGNEADALLVS